MVSIIQFSVSLIPGCSEQPEKKKGTAIKVQNKSCLFGKSTTKYHQKGFNKFTLYTVDFCHEDVLHAIAIDTRQLDH